MPTPSLPHNCSVAMAVLDGGHSRRMGTDKRALKLGGETLLDRAIRTSRSTGCQVLRVTTDHTPNQGPLGGVDAAFSSAAADWILFVPCDMPFLTAAILLQVLERAVTLDNAVFTEVNGRLGFPFALHRRHLPVVQRRLNEGHRSLLGLAEALEARHLTFSAEGSLPFHNINDPQDYEVARAMWEGLTKGQGD